MVKGVEMLRARGKNWGVEGVEGKATNVLIATVKHKS